MKPADAEAPDPAVVGLLRWYPRTVEKMLGAVAAAAVPALLSTSIIWYAAIQRCRAM